MKKLHIPKRWAQRGFTLVELAIVMTIIGLLIGGILKGQELMQNARVTATIAQVRSYEAATTTFRDSFAAIPGDMNNASTRITGCDVSCNPCATGPACTAPSPGAGDSMVGSPVWASTLAWASQTPASMVTTGAQTAPGAETVLFWRHLSLADLIAGISSSANIAWADSHPQARIGGGFIVGMGNGTRPPGAAAIAPLNGGPSGMILALVQSPNTGTVATMTATGQQPVPPSRAAQIDRKMDDGRPAGGFVQAYGLTGSCYNTGAPFTATAPGYLETVVANDCGLMFRIQG